MIVADGSTDSLTGCLFPGECRLVTGALSALLLCSNFSGDRLTANLTVGPCVTFH